MTWTGRPDDISCCGDVPGVVDSEETVARLLHSKIIDPEHLAFTRKELTWDGQKAPFDNTCGLADGCSVDRCAALSDDTLRQRAEAVAGLRPGREGQGALVAKVGDLRNITCELAPAGRAVYVYDDPMNDNREHAVIRVSQVIPRADFDEVRAEIFKAFVGRVAP